MDWASILLARILAGEPYQRASKREWRWGIAFLAALPFGVLFVRALTPIAGNESLLVIWATVVAFGVVGLFLIWLFGHFLSLFGVALLAALTWIFVGLLFWLS